MKIEQTADRTLTPQTGQRRNGLRICDPCCWTEKTSDFLAFRILAASLITFHLVPISSPVDVLAVVFLNSSAVSSKMDPCGAALRQDASLLIGRGAGG